MFRFRSAGFLRFVGVDAGMNALARPVLYGAYHEIVNLSRLGAALAWTDDLGGPICESGDVLGHAHRLLETEEGDVVLVATTGAYGHAMASAYNLRPLPEEVMVEFSGGAAGASLISSPSDYLCISSEHHIDSRMEPKVLLRSIPDA